MSDKPKWDLTSTGSLTGAAEWIRRRAYAPGNECLVVLVIRRQDVAFCCDPKITPADVGELIATELPRLVESLTARRMGKAG